MMKLKSYNSLNEIFVDLDLEENEMEALRDIFEKYGKFQYDEETHHIFTPKKPNSQQNRLEEEYRWIKFVIWTYTF